MSQRGREVMNISFSGCRNIPLQRNCPKNDKGLLRTDIWLCRRPVHRHFNLYKILSTCTKTISSKKWWFFFSSYWEEKSVKEKEMGLRHSLVGRVLKEHAEPLSWIPQPPGTLYGGRHKPTNSTWKQLYKTKSSFPVMDLLQTKRPIFHGMISHIRYLEMWINFHEGPPIHNQTSYTLHTQFSIFHRNFSLEGNLKKLEMDRGQQQ